MAGKTTPDPGKGSWFPLAHILHPEAVRQLADGTSFTRGQDYFLDNKVIRLERVDRQLKATVSGSQHYSVAIWVHDDSLAYSCSCPHSQEEGAFCKHLVATCLAWLSSQQPTTLQQRHLNQLLGDLGEEELRALIVERAKRDPLWFAELIRTLGGRGET